jgi:hypothetical protein
MALLALQEHFAEISHDIRACLSFHQILIFNEVRDSLINPLPEGMRFIFLVRMVRWVLVDDWFDFGSLSSHGTPAFPTQYKATHGQYLINALLGKVQY